MKKLALALLLSVSINALASYNTTQESLSPDENEVTVTLNGATQAYHLKGKRLAVGDKMPSAKLLANDNGELIDVSSSNGDKVKIYVTLPCVNSNVCQEQVKNITEYLNKNDDQISGIEVSVISVNTDTEQTHFLEKHKPHQNLKFLSALPAPEFGKSIGAMIEELSQLTRAIFVVGKEGEVKHAQYVPELTLLPDFEQAVSIAKTLNSEQVSDTAETPNSEQVSDNAETQNSEQVSDNGNQDT